MKRTKEKLSYPENAYYEMLCEDINLPPNAEKLLESVLEHLFPRESKEMFMLRYKEGLTFQKISDLHNLSVSRVRQIIAKTQRKLRFFGGSNAREFVSLLHERK